MSEFSEARKFCDAIAVENLRALERLQSGGRKARRGVTAAHMMEYLANSHRCLSMVAEVLRRAEELEEEVSRLRGRTPATEQTMFQGDHQSLL